MHMHSYISTEYHNLFFHILQYIFYKSVCVPVLLVMWYMYICFQPSKVLVTGISLVTSVGRGNSLEPGRVLLGSHLYLFCSYTLYSCLSKLLPKEGD